MDTDPKLLEILVCPLTKTTLHYDRDKQELVSRAAGLAYPIRGGVPMMLPGEARAAERRGTRWPLDDALAHRTAAQSGDAMC